MKAAVVFAAGQAPVYADFRDPQSAEGSEVLRVTAAALTHLSKGRASGTHYSSAGAYPLVPGVDGVGHAADGRRLYFVMPEAPFGAMAEQTLVRPEHCLAVPDGLDDVTAAALANPGMSAWAALVLRAQLRAGDTVLVNGATGVAGRIAVQIAKQLGAYRIVVTGRNAAELAALRDLGADLAVPFSIGPDTPGGEKLFEDELKPHLADGIDVVVDYLWGPSALAIMTAIAKAAPEARPVRFVQVGSAGGQDVLPLPSAALRSSSLVLMGSGLKSVPLPGLIEAVRQSFDMAAAGALRIDAQAVPLAKVAENWEGAGARPRIVFTP